jgi:hypothetical protein
MLNVLPVVAEEIVPGVPEEDYRDRGDFYFVKHFLIKSI